MEESNPEIGKSIEILGRATNYHDIGSGYPVLLIHGSGPGVSAWANWRSTIQGLSDGFRMVAPDMLGFGYSDTNDIAQYDRELWVGQLIGLLDKLDIGRVHVIGNSFGGSMALALAISHPERVSRLVTMGAVGVPFKLTHALDAVWGYEPSFDNMKEMMRYFAFDQSIVTNDLVELRYKASIRPGTREAYAGMFPAPRQRWVDAMAHPEAEVRSIDHPTLVVHGRDDQVIPLSTSLTLSDWIPNSELHVFGQCGHWTQIERAREFTALVGGFLKR